jgi:hypothetical protein
MESQSERLNCSFPYISVPLSSGVPVREMSVWEGTLTTVSRQPCYCAWNIWLHETTLTVKDYVYACVYICMYLSTLVIASHVYACMYVYMCMYMTVTVMYFCRKDMRFLRVSYLSMRESPSECFGLLSSSLLV